MPTSNPKPTSDFEKASQGALFALGGVVSFTAAPFVGACIGTLAYWQMQRRGYGLLESVGATYNLLKEGISDLVVLPQAALQSLSARFQRPQSDSHRQAH